MLLDLLCNLIIRPPRAVYNPHRDLPGPALRIAQRTFVRTDLQLRNEQGQTLECSHYTPEVWVQQALPCVIFLHGNSGCRIDAYDAVRVLLPLNITVFTLDLSGSGLSEGEFISLGVRESEDLRAVIAHLRAGGRVTKIGLWGRSMGAATSLFYGQKDPSVAALVLDSPFSKLTDLMHELVDTFGRQRGVRVPRPLVRPVVALLRLSIQRRAHFDIHDLDVTAAAAGSFVPALFGHATGDTFILPSHSEALYAVYPGDKNFIRFEGDHNSQRPAFFFDSVSIFFLNTLHPPEALPPGAQPPRGANGPAGSAQPYVPAEMPPPPLVPVGAAPTPELEMLLQMGFPRAVAERALRRFRTVELASTWLVDAGEDGWATLMAEGQGALGGAPPPRVQVLDLGPAATGGGALGASAAALAADAEAAAAAAAASAPVAAPGSASGAGAGTRDAGPAFGDADEGDDAARDRALAATLARSLAAAGASRPPASGPP